MEISAQPYDIWHMQSRLYVVDSFTQLEEAFARWTESIGLG
jgi:phenylalanine-4-hydroxylase